jgi:hypothetical protein
VGWRWRRRWWCNSGHCLTGASVLRIPRGRVLPAAALRPHRQSLIAAALLSQHRRKASMADTLEVSPRSFGPPNLLRKYPPSGRAEAIAARLCGAVEKRRGRAPRPARVCPACGCVWLRVAACARVALTGSNDGGASNFFKFIMYFAPN